ncbi:amidohydrolase [Desulfosarcina alkanivorans]|uniref:Amidohydrolase n=1 Tax=Desulfosarcina alkanivorans TaxID=571177 RepID=A0A5K7YFQ3_9BACT|nr:amidohydrolase [Desulfosarcina alkanivorans]BBO67866.1 amidohydrolase [Desulfosarcina alkanivorans]
MNSTSPSPDIILFNGTIATQNVHQPTAKAMAVGQGQILATGSSDKILGMAGAGTETIDLDGRLVVPGFIDTHIHFYEWSLKRQGVKLTDLTGLDGLLERVRQAAEGRPPGQWIMGQGWNETDWTAPHVPTREALDRAAPDHPVLLWRCDLHLAAANTAALRAAGIDADTPDPPEGRIERDASGTPTGILRELAINLVRRAVAPPDEDQVAAAFTEASRALHRRGVTGIHDVRLMADTDGAAAFQAFQRLDREGRLALRSWVTLPGHRLDDIIGLGLQTGFGNDRLRVGHVKFFSDGGMGARTAWMIDPFQDAGCGMPLMDMAKLAQDIRRADAAGLSTMVHAVGDRANRELIAMFEDLESRRAGSKTPRPSIPHRIEHVQMIRPEDAERLRDLGLALCVTPANMVLDINLIDSAVGEKGRWTYAFRRLMDTGSAVMFSSDCPVCDPDPLTGIHAAVTRQRADGTPTGGWHPHNRITVPEAIRAYTATPAAVHQAHDLGTIAPGKKADLAVLGENILTSDPSGISGTHVDMTVFDGRIVYRQF